MRNARALAAGLLIALSLPPWGWWPLAIVGVALFASSLGSGREPDQTRRRTRALRGWLFGVGWLLPGMAWMWFLTAPGYLVATALFAGFHAAAAAVSPTGRWRAIGGPAAHTLAEAIRMAFPFGGVPLATLGISQVVGPLGSLARVGGVLLITWVTFQIGFALVGPAPGSRSRLVGSRSNEGRSTAAAHSAIALGIALLALVVSFAAPRGEGNGEHITVAVVQGGGPQGTRAIHTDPQVVVDRHIEATRTIPDDAGRNGDVDLVVWPENVIDVNGESFEGSAANQEVALEADRIGAPFSVGITEDVSPGRFTNAQVIVTPDGDVVSRYDKVRRVPFGEYMPFRDLLGALGAPVDLVPNDAVAGTTPGLLTAPIESRGDVDMGVVISWEVFFGGRAREGVKAGGEFITNPTNGSSYTWTILQTQQVASSRLRAIENGRWVVQAAPTGFSAFISPSGDVFDRTSVSEQTVIDHEIELRTGLTWYAHLGEWPYVIALLVVLAVSSVAASGRLQSGRLRARSSP